MSWVVGLLGHESTDDCEGIAPVPFRVRPEPRRPGWDYRSLNLADGIHTRRRLNRVVPVNAYPIPFSLSVREEPKGTYRRILAARLTFPGHSPWSCAESPIAGRRGARYPMHDYSATRTAANTRRKLPPNSFAKSSSVQPRARRWAVSRTQRSGAAKSSSA